MSDLVAAEVEKGNNAVKEAGFIDLGSMKGNIGDQNYEIPADADLSKYQHGFDLVCSLWCKFRHRSFGIGKELI